VQPARLLSRVAEEETLAQAEVSLGVVSTGRMSDNGYAML